ncbi:hypothetical protein DY000_02062341 [Brassica cretica]|uniref:Uncharacterized protein n=1 Tax=Brassica cretica TaxID=69181 RepID=A0ABQ7AQ37_BRACR|nr:hypothetical protein DY000_02062341 [Brassica cretica]
MIVSLFYVVGAGLFTGVTVALYPVSVVKTSFKLLPKISLGLSKTVIKKTATRRRKLKAVTLTIVKMENKPMARNRALVAEDVVAAAALVMEKVRRS